MLPIALATVLTLIPLTLLVPGLQELVVQAHGATRLEAHLFMAANMATGIVAVPVTMRLLRPSRHLPRWLAVLLALDALAFVGMGRAEGLPALFAWRLLDGALHLPAVTLLMVLANRLAGPRSGGPLGLVASALMLGIAIGAPLGGVLVSRGGGALVYPAGAALLVVAALSTLAVRAAPAPAPVRGSRYAWDRRKLAAWTPLAFGFLDRFLIGVFTSTFTLFLAEVHGVAPAARGTLLSLFMLPFALLCWPMGRLADRTGWFWPVVGGNAAFGALFATYGVIPQPLLWVAMLLSGVVSAAMFAPNLLLVSEFARRGAGEGLFGAFQIAGSLGFLAGPLAGGMLLEGARWWSPGGSYPLVFAMVGVLQVGVAVWSGRALWPLAARWAHDDATTQLAGPDAPRQRTAVA